MKFYIILYAIIAIFMAFVVMYIAIKKGRKPLPWFLIGLGFSIIGFLIAIFVTRKVKQ